MAVSSLRDGELRPGLEPHGRAVRRHRARVRRTPLDVPLLEHSPDPDIGLAYLGDRSAELRLCRLVALHLQLADLSNHLVIIAPDARGADLPHALYTGLRRDVERCQSEQHGLAVVVEPDAEPDALERGSATP